MEKLTREQVLHVADLAKIHLTEEEIEKYGYQLKQILDEIGKINDVKINNDEFMISPTDNTNVYHFDEVKEILEIEEVLKNAPKTNGNYIEVPLVLNE